MLRSGRGGQILERVAIASLFYAASHLVRKGSDAALLHVTQNFTVQDYILDTRQKRERLFIVFIDAKKPLRRAVLDTGAGSRF